ncbi:hypothetical protein [Streptomyces poonensis]|uniref:Uncharacterized protein n=1 Tax=Streptomyces poonensis TaxID=68255 RepID=A0A918PRQ3_9ACTN|nr:hypothetical protein [Streptomyces poonensis]GGZ20695.1 hypothetical protein GCM10010365_46260 [Streptomyces poonensis]
MQYPHEPAPAVNIGDTASTGHGTDVEQELGQRLRNLEKQVDTLTLAVQALVQGLEGLVGNGPVDGGRAVRAARLAHDILLVRGL